MKDGKLAYDTNIGGEHHLIVFPTVRSGGQPQAGGTHAATRRNLATLDRRRAGGADTQNGFAEFPSPGRALDIGQTGFPGPVSHYEAVRSSPASCARSPC